MHVLLNCDQTVTDVITMTDSPHYCDALDTLMDLREAPLSLNTQVLCRLVQHFADRIAIEVAKEQMGS